MLNLTTHQILKFIDNETSFEGMLSEESGPGLYIKIDEYVPYVCCALHQGHNLRKELEPLCALSPEQRYHEEDLFAGNLISSLPIVLVPQDSRYEYDLNLFPEDCVYDVAWGEKVWKRELSTEEKQRSTQKHKQFYEIFSKLIAKIIKKWSGCVIFDIRSYNIEERGYAHPPVFNVASNFLSKGKHERTVKRWETELAKIHLPNIDVTVAENEVFSGKAYLAKHMAETCHNCLVLPTEISKIFFDKKTIQPYPLVVDALRVGLKSAIISTAIDFSKKETNLKKASKRALLSSSLEKSVLQIDKKIYQLGSGFNTLSFLNPLNYSTEKKRFFSNKFRHNPEFKYKQLNVNPYKFKEALYRLPIDDIADITLLKLYRAVVDSLAVKVEMLATVGKSDFIYNSLKYYGEPSINDLANAKFILHLQDESDQAEDELISVDKAVNAFKEAGKHYGIDLKIEVSTKIIAHALVNNLKVVINKNLRITKQELKALINHELGVHVLTMRNAMLQPLNIFKIGLPFNTLTQEGLAILSEYLCGSLSIKRLKILSLRVIAVSLMLKNYNFKRVFMALVDTYKMDPDEAFAMTARIFRGGGFTKDYLYLRGFKLAYKAYLAGMNLSDLLIGKTSFQYHNEIVELMERKILVPPQYQTQSFVTPLKEDNVISYIVSCIR